MRALLGMAVFSLLAACSCGAIVFTAPERPTYPAPPRTSAAVESSAELRLPYVTDLRAPGTAYAGEPLTIEFDITAEDAPQLLVERALPPLALQVGQQPEEGYAGKITLGPWLLAEPPALLEGESDQPLQRVDLTLRLSQPGTYLIEWQSADKPEHGGRPARYFDSGTEFIRGEVAIQTREMLLTVWPSRNPVVVTPRYHDDGQRFYNEPYGAFGSSEATWDYWNRPEQDGPRKPWR